MNCSTKKGFLGISPLLFFLVFYLSVSIIVGDFNIVPNTFVFFISSVFAIAMTRGKTLSERLRQYGKGAGSERVMFMIWIFLSAGVFAASAEAMGCVKETVDAILMILPSKYLFLSIFLASCVISMATGSGIGSIVAVAPVAIKAAETIGYGMPIICSAVVCGAMFGDNLSFISDTTIISTTSQGCQLKDKFRANLWLAAPACIVTSIVYLIIGSDVPSVEINETVEYIKLIPYIFVLVLSISGVDVLLLLLLGTLICMVMGLVGGDFDFIDWMGAVAQGIESMGALSLVILMASGMLALIKYNGGIDFIISLCMKIVRGRRTAELCICLLSALMVICTANNTIAIISISDIVKHLSAQFGVEPRRAASLMDTSSCVLQELIPYSTHLLAIAGLAGIATTSMIPFMYYSFFLGAAVLVSVAFPRKKVN